MKGIIIGFVVFCAVLPMMAQKLAVKIINRQDIDTEYFYVVPGYSYSSLNAAANCIRAQNTINCNGSDRTVTAGIPGEQVSYHLRGATLTLKLPDGRAAVVNCDNTFVGRTVGLHGSHRSCRVPLGDNIAVELRSHKAKLKWAVSLDGRKIASETYKVIAILSESRTL